MDSKKHLKPFTHKRYIFFALILILLVSFNTLADFKESDKKLERVFKKIGKEVQISHVLHLGKKLRYYSPEKIDASKPSIIFIHGAPGTGGNFMDYLKDEDLINSANLICLDRLGYGYSDLGNAVTSITEQAESIYAIIQKHKLKNVTLVAWSFGVPIAGKMAAMYPEINHSVLVAGAVSAEHEKYFKLGKLAHWKSTRWMMPKSFRVADDEKSTHEEELTNMQADWSKIKSKVTYYHGTKDWIVPYDNMTFIKDNVNNEVLTAKIIEGEGHFIIFSEFEEIKSRLLNFITNG
ncbi:MAG: alpha/beta hydrolase [Bacteroidia bacterium]|nr:alpha/beta hydrolase [Bacteroidia bacterium]NNC86710.1 alpha/beta hydrolase [Bacteroidia bacterium]NNM16818.1 alpha/beta hydrolase [Bacteroidia bacterium]